MEATCALYGLIHARYVLTTAGLEAMYAKYTLQVQCSARCGCHEDVVVVFRDEVGERLRCLIWRQCLDRVMCRRPARYVRARFLLTGVLRNMC